MLLLIVDVQRYDPPVVTKEDMTSSGDTFKLKDNKQIQGHKANGAFENMCKYKGPLKWLKPNHERVVCRR